MRQCVTCSSSKRWMEQRVLLLVSLLQLIKFQVTDHTVRVRVRPKQLFRATISYFSGRQPFLSSSTSFGGAQHNKCALLLTWVCGVRTAVVLFFISIVHLFVRNYAAVWRHHSFVKKRKMDGLDLMQANWHTTHTPLRKEIEKPVKKNDFLLKWRSEQGQSRVCACVCLNRLQSERRAQTILPRKKQNSISMRKQNKTKMWVEERRWRKKNDIIYSCTFSVSFWYQFYGALVYVCVCVRGLLVCMFCCLLLPISPP